MAMSFVLCINEPGMISSFLRESGIRRSHLAHLFNEKTNFKTKEPCDRIYLHTHIFHKHEHKNVSFFLSNLL